MDPFPSTESPLDRALSAHLAGKHEDALRHVLAACDGDSMRLSALYALGRILRGAGDSALALTAFELLVSRGLDTGPFPIVVAAALEMREIEGKGAASSLAAMTRAANAYANGSLRFARGESVPPPPLARPATPAQAPPGTSLDALKAAAKKCLENVAAKPSAQLRLVPAPIFSELSVPELAELLAVIDVTLIPQGEQIVSEGDDADEAYVIARGEVEVTKKIAGASSPLALARLAAGQLFGEMALMARAPRNATVVAVRPTVLLTVRREPLEKLAVKTPAVATALATYCRSRMIANVLRTSPVLLAVDEAERSIFVERFQTRVYEHGEKLVVADRETEGLHIIASGDVSVVRKEAGGDSLVLARLGAGHVVGEMGLILRRKTAANVVADHPTVTLYLPRAEFLSVVKEHPMILLRLYLLAVSREEETSAAVSAATAVADEFVLV